MLTYMKRRGHRRARVIATPLRALVVLFVSLGSWSLSSGAGATGSTPDNGANPVLLTRAGTSPYVYVLWSTPCGSLACYRLERLSASGRSSALVLAPPISHSREFTEGGLEELVFANVHDGYALVSSPKGESSTLYATFDGAHSWHRESFVKGEAPVSITASQDAFYAVAALPCPKGHTNCETWRISRSAVGSRSWAAVSRSYQFGHDSDYPYIAAFGSRVFLTTQEQSEPGQTFFASSDDDGRIFKVATVTNLSSVNQCSLLPTSTVVIWAGCDDGNMQGTVEVSADGGDHWRVLSEGLLGTHFAFGTLDPVSSDLTYLDNGLETHQLWRIGYKSKGSSLTGRLPYPEVAELSFTDADHGFALSPTIGPKNRQVLYETSDAGRRWTRLFA
jgi:photosystem II stability/assembly factor-like uncharacterized protein